MNDLTLRRAFNGGWVLSATGNDGIIQPFHAFSSTEDLMKALPALLEKSSSTPFLKDGGQGVGAGAVQYINR